MVVLALAAFASPAMAQRAEQPTLKVGDRWQFVEYYTVASTVPNRDWAITSASSARIEATENGEPLTLTADLNVLESPRNKYSNPRTLSFPLEIGKKWRFTTDWLFKVTGSKGTADIDVEVVGYERVAVAGGAYDAFKLVSKASMQGMSTKNSRIEGDVTSTYWYAPAARAIVKSITHNPYVGVITVELVKAEPAP
jgi:hypothetical protein